jgi:hypothetical protein
MYSWLAMANSFFSRSRVELAAHAVWEVDFLIKSIVAHNPSLV